MTFAQRQNHVTTHFSEHILLLSYACLYIKLERNCFISHRVQFTVH